MKIVEDINRLLSEVAHFLGKIPVIAWIGIGFGIVAEDVLDSMEDKIQCKIDFVEKIIVPSDKRKEKRR